LDALDALGSTWTLWTHLDALGSTGTHWEALGRTGKHLDALDALGRTGKHWDALGRIGTHWDALGRIGVHGSEALGRIEKPQSFVFMSLLELRFQAELFPSQLKSNKVSGKHDKPHQHGSR